MMFCKVFKAFTKKRKIKKSIPIFNKRKSDIIPNFNKIAQLKIVKKAFNEGNITKNEFGEILDELLD